MPSKKQNVSRRNNAGRRPTKSQVMGVSDFAPKEVTPTSDPRPVEYSIKIPKRIQIQVVLPESGNHSVTVSELMGGVPGGITYWNRVRFERFDVWSGADAASSDVLTVTVSPQNDWSQPVFSVKDSGTVGNTRAKVGFRLGLLDRARYFGTAATTELFVVGGLATSEVIIQASVELISPGL